MRDAARTLMKAAILIRKRGLQARMEEPEAFLNRMNRLCMKMTHARRKKDAKRARKAAPREPAGSLRRTRNGIGNCCGNIGGKRI